MRAYEGSTSSSSHLYCALQGIANAVWACGELRHHPGPLVGAVLADLRRRGEGYSLKDWSLVLWGFTCVGEDTRDVLQMLDSRVQFPMWRLALKEPCRGSLVFSI